MNWSIIPFSYLENKAPSSELTLIMGLVVLGCRLVCQGQGQGQGQDQGQCTFGLRMVTNRENITTAIEHVISQVGFLLAYLEFTLTNSKGQVGLWNGIEPIF